MKIVNRLLFCLHIFVGIGAIVGGSAAIFHPESPLGMPTEVLKNSPFSDFFIPGIILFSIIGLGNILSSITMYLKVKYQSYISGIFSGALVIWIVVQCIMLNSVVFLHVLFFIIGLVQGVLSITILFEQRLFPTNIIITLSKKILKNTN